MSNLVQIAAITMAFTFASTSSAYAYLDPGSGSLILQAVIGIIAGAAMTGKLYWHRILAFFKRRRDLKKASK